MKCRIGFIVCVAASLSMSASAAATGEQNRVFSGRIYPLVEYFEWKEFLEGQQFVKETGPLFGVGGEVDFPLGKNLRIVPDGNLFIGQVNYDGAIQQLDGTLVPAKSTTVYYGLEGSLKLAAPIAVNEGVTLKPVAGLGIRAWERVLDSSFSSQYIGDYGYTEDWVMTHGILGAELDFSSAPKTEFYLRGEARLPIWTQQYVDASNVGGPSSISLQPKARTTIYAEAGLRRNSLFIAAFVETLNFGQSDWDSTYGQYLQPESKASIFGGKIGLAF